MDLHRLNEERSLAYHRSIAEKLRREPELLDAVRARVAGWLVGQEAQRFYAQQWAAVLRREPEEVATFISGPSDLAVELRQSSPFVGILAPHERWQIWRETRERFAKAS